MIVVFFISCISSIFLLYGISNLSISFYEAELFFDSRSVVAYFARFFTSQFGQNDFALRIPFLILHILTLSLMYKVSKKYLKRNDDRFFSLAIFALLPGVNSAAILLNSAGVVIFLTLLFVYMYQSFKHYSYFLLPLYLLIDNSFAALYLSLVLYGYFKEQKSLYILSFILFVLSLFIFGFDGGGKPSGHFLDSLGVYAAIFSPFVFIYFFYTLYRILIKGEKNILWYISFSALMFSLILSFRQKILFEDFAPFVVLAIPLMVKTFFESYRVRMARYRKAHFFFLILVLVTLVANYLLLFFNKSLYHFVPKSDDHFAYKYHIAKELSQKLKEMGIHSGTFLDNKMQKRVLFYGIKSSNKYIISKNKTFPTDFNVTISYKDMPIAIYYVTKVNIQ